MAEEGREREMLREMLGGEGMREDELDRTEGA